MTPKSAPSASHTSAPTPEPLRIDLREALRILWKYKWLVVGAALAVTLGVTFWTLRQPKIYEAVASVEYDPDPPRPLGSEIEDVTNPNGNYWSTREFFETQNRIIGSRAVAERVVRKVGLHRDGGFFAVGRDARATWRGVTVERAARELQERITVEQVKDTRIVLIRVHDWDPERATVLANAVADAYIEKTIEDRLGSTMTALEWLSTQLDNLKQQLERSENALHEFRRENNVLSVSMQERQNMVANDIQNLSEALTNVRTKRIELQSRVQQLRQANREDPLEVHAQAVASDQLVQALRNEYRTKRAELDSLALRYGPNHPNIEALAAQLDSLRTQLRQTTDGVIASAEADLREVSSTEDGIRRALDDANVAGLELNLREIEFGRLNRERENNSKLYSVLLERTTETDLTRMLRVTHARLLDRALKPTEPVRPRLRLNIGLGALAGVVLGLALAFLVSRLDRSVKSVEDAEQLGMTVLGILPTIEEGPNGPKRVRPSRRQLPAASTERDLIVHTHPMSSVAECCRTIRTNLMFTSADDPLHALVITSAGPREGKTTVATSIAIVLAQSGKRVLLIDTDLRRPRVHRTFGLSSNVGITSVLVGEASLDEALTETPVPGLWVLPCGPIPPNPSELLHTSRFRDLVREASGKFDRVIFDSPPLGAVTDAAIIAPQVDGALLVMKAYRTNRDAIASAVRQLRDVGASIVGGVLNDVNLAEQRYGYGSYYYYRRQGYYSSDSTTESSSNERPTQNAAE